MEPKITEIRTEIICTGLARTTTAKTMMKDLPKIYSDYMILKQQGKIHDIQSPWEYISLSTNFRGPREWDYYTGYVVNEGKDLEEPLKKFVVPMGEYVAFPLRCRKRIFFRIKIGMLKRFIYTKWLPKSKYKFDGYEYEYNNEENRKESPYDIDLYVKVVEK